jgi:Arc/MetJ family transcription regulator
MRLDASSEGIGAVDEGQLASAIRLNREREVNAGYDDAERAAQTLGLRTGSSAVGDALTALARDRVRAQAQIGDPALEALQTAQGVNSQRSGDIMSQYGVFGNRASIMPDVSFTPAPYAGIADAKLGDQQKFDLSKFDVAQGGSGLAATGIGQAATGLRQAYDTSPLKTGNILSSIGQTVGAAGNNKDITSALMKLFGG